VGGVVTIAIYSYIGLDFVIRICVREDEMLEILKALHAEPYDGNFVDK